MELTKRDSKVLKGVAILSLLMLHLFCRKENLPYQPLFYIGKTPLIYYFGLFGDICVPIFCFVSGYAHWLAAEGSLHLKRLKTIFQFCTNLWIILGGGNARRPAHRKSNDSWQLERICAQRADAEKQL